jgi:hypothetical protein
MLLASYLSDRLASDGLCRKRRSCAEAGDSWPLYCRCAKMAMYPIVVNVALDLSVTWQGTQRSNDDKQVPHDGLGGRLRSRERGYLDPN